MRHPKKSLVRSSHGDNAANASEALDDLSRERSAERAVREIKLQGTPRNTLRALDSAERYWAAWYTLRYRKRMLPRPVPKDVIIQFIVDHGARDSRDTPGTLTCELPPKVDRVLIELGVKKEGLLSFQTIRQRVSLVGRLNSPHLNGMPNPASDPDVKDLLLALHRTYAQLRESRPGRSKSEGSEKDRAWLRGGRRPALTAGPLKELLSVLEKDVDDEASTWRYRRALRDRAMLLFAFGSGGRRRAEVTSAVMERLKREKNGDYTYTLGATKTDRGTKKDDEVRRKPLKHDAARAMDAWLDEAQLRSGPIFRRITKRGRITGRGLTPASLRNLVTRLAREAKLEHEGYSAHSLRSGYITEAAYSGVALADAMVLSGHKSMQTALRYYRIQNPHDSPGANLADGLTTIKLKKRRR